MNDIDINQDQDPNERLPRPELTEPAFRRFEHIIARVAVERTFHIPPALFPAGKSSARKRMSSTTFCSRFRDALLAYKLYKYTSMQIPRGCDLSAVRCFQNRNGSVTVENELAGVGIIQTAVAVDLNKPSFYHAKDRDTILTLINEMQKPTTIIGTSHDIHYDTPTERDWLLSNGGTLASVVDGENVVNLMKLPPQ